MVSGADSSSFQSTPSAWRETYLIHVGKFEIVFQSTPSAWRETASSARKRSFSLFQSTPSAWRETIKIIIGLRNQNISIHSLRMEGDCRRAIKRLTPRDFNPLPPHGGRQHPHEHLLVHNAISIHSLRMEGDININHNNTPPKIFQSTPSAWRETLDG